VSAGASPIVLIHGFGCDARFWQPQLAALKAPGGALQAPDLPFHGGPTQGVAPTLPDLARWVTETCLTSPGVLVGHSLGGMLALQIARDAPEQVLAVVLVDAFPNLRLNAAHLPGLYAGQRHADVRGRVEAMRSQVIAQASPGALEALWPTVEAFDASPWLPDVRPPVYGIYGGRGLYRADETRRLAGDLGLSRVPRCGGLVIVPNAGHFVHLECPEAVNATLVGWLAAGTMEARAQ
jgi:pimeloyl-ACP methyl ester carboxylesterase